MQVIADIFLGAGALGAAVYCLVLARRLNRFNDLEKGVGGAVAVLSSQVDDLTSALTEAQALSRSMQHHLGVVGLDPQYRCDLGMGKFEHLF